jgi:hypothetical protein
MAMKSMFWMICGLWALGAAGILSGQEAPRVSPPLGEGDGVRKGSEVEHRAAFLGVLTREVPEEAATHLGLSPGFGLMVEEVMAGSPAAKAGVQRLDVLTQFNDQELINMEQLQVLVRRGKKGDAVALTLFSKGEKKVVQVALDEGPVEMPARERLRRFPGGGLLPEWERQHEWREQTDRLQRELREFREQLQHWLKDGRHGPMPEPPRWRAPGGEGGVGGAPKAEVHTEVKTEAHSQGKVIRRDESGEYVLSHEDGSAMFAAAPKEGEGGRWPVTNEAERAAVPERFRDKLNGLLEVREETERQQREKGKP